MPRQLLRRQWKTLTCCKAPAAMSQPCWILSTFGSRSGSLIPGEHSTLSDAVSTCLVTSPDHELSILQLRVLKFGHALLGLDGVSVQGLF